MPTQNLAIPSGSTSRWAWSIRDDGLTNLGGTSLSVIAGVALGDATISGLRYLLTAAIPPGSRIDAVTAWQRAAFEEGGDVDCDLHYSNESSGGDFNTGARKPVLLPLSSTSVSWVATAVGDSLVSVDITAVFRAWFAAYGAAVNQAFILLYVGNTGVSPARSLELSTPAEVNPPGLDITWTAPSLVARPAPSSRLLVMGVLE